MQQRNRGLHIAQQEVDMLIPTGIVVASECIRKKTGVRID